MVSQLQGRRTFEAAIDAIVEMIEHDGARVGTRLGTAASLSTALGISIPTLRQALGVLERAGVIEVRRGTAGGIFVVCEMLPVEAVAGGVAREEGAIADLLQARRLLEPLVYELALHAATDEDIAELQHSIDLGWRHVGDRQWVFRSDAMYHRAWARACHNSVLMQVMTMVYRQLLPVQDALLEGTPDDARHLLEVHGRQLDALRRRDARALRQALDETHITLEEEFTEVIRR